MIHFDQDYAEGAHPKILERLIETNMKQEAGYGNDYYSEKAREYIKESCENNELDVHFLSAGTQTNTIVIASALRPHQGVIAADSGHIQTLETGAIEAIGHKILLLPTKEGKISAEEVAGLCEKYWNDEANIHKVQPAMLHIANPTEVGTLYTKQELKDLSEVSKEYQLKFFIDGARLGYGLSAETNDLTMKDIVNLTDVFYIGGTKNGALLGEAVVIKDAELKKDFRSIMKQKGALLAKGRLLGIQFETLFRNNLYFEIAKHAVKQAMRIKKTLIENNIIMKY
ncbi:MAG: beta-eliminating lyase-related protein, partial [Atopostipes suicloacalis]|nr:beta-eliminating lyase-related protein [Atopostipes suicloacalis]